MFEAVLASEGIGFVRRNLKPILITSIGLLTAVYVWHLRGRVDDLQHDLSAATAERDIYKASAETQAAGVKARDESISRLNVQIAKMLRDWRDTRSDAAQVQAQSKAREDRYRATIADLKEKSNAEDADPIGLALDALDRLCREQGARTGTAAGGC